MFKKIVRPLDLIIILSICAAIGIISFRVYNVDGRPAMVSIKSESGLSIYPLDQDQHLEFVGPIGSTIVEIANKQVQVVSSPCKDKLCMISGILLKNGDWTACMPNRIYVVIKGGTEEELDEISY